MKKGLFIIFFVLLLLSSAQAWENICESQKNPYCSNIGKIAYDGYSGLKLGKIIGVTYRPKGSNIGLSPSPRDAFYYIIDDGSISNGKKQKPFIRQCREIEAKKNLTSLQKRNQNSLT